ncbi:MaoC family dehydratase [Streptomyces sp. NPDC047002]|uniref:MaoC family dehydratase n=1 Tax=Streptomyces sp. NPDC047002 TaxID=3155475 RepID=UPI0034522C96
MTASDLAVGAHLSSRPLMMTRERMRWYCDALETAASQSGAFIVAEPTIHTDAEYARAQGLPGIIADGMLSTNYLSSLLYRHFGVAYLRGGELATKFIRPVYEDDVLQAHAVVTGVEEGRRTLELWVETESGQKVTVGTASVPASQEEVPA